MSILPAVRRRKSMLVYVFFLIAVVMFFFQQAQEGKLAVSSRPSGARVFLDRKDYGKTPLTVILTRGEYQIEVVLEGFEPVSRKVLIEGGETFSLDVDLVRTSK